MSIQSPKLALCFLDGFAHIQMLPMAPLPVLDVIFERWWEVNVTLAEATESTVFHEFSELIELKCLCIF